MRVQHLGTLTVLLVSTWSALSLKASDSFSFPNDNIENDAFLKGNDFKHLDDIIASLPPTIQRTHIPDKLTTLQERKRLQKIIDFVDHRLQDGNSSLIRQHTRLARRTIPSSSQQDVDDEGARQYFAKHPKALLYVDSRREVYFRLPTHSSRAPTEQTFRALKKIAEGEDGLVFLAVDIDNPKDLVALKSLKFNSVIYQNNQNTFVQLAIYEAMKTFHKGDLIAVGIRKGLREPEAYFAMKYHNGLPLAHHMAQNIGKWGYREYSLIARRMNSAIEDLHRRGVVHRDLHAKNILVTRVDNEGIPCELEIIDFGRGQLLPAENNDAKSLQKRLQDYMEFVGYGLKPYVLKYSVNMPKVSQAFNDMIIELRRDILEPRRFFAVPVHNIPSPMEIDRETKALMFHAARASMFKPNPSSLLLLRHQGVHMQIVEDAKFRTLNAQAVGFFSVDGRLIAEAYHNREGNDVLLMLGYQCFLVPR